MAKRAANDVKEAAQNAGGGLRNLSNWIDGVTKSLTGFDQAAHPLKGSGHYGVPAGGAAIPDTGQGTMRFLGLGSEVFRPGSAASLPPRPGGVGYDWSGYKSAGTDPHAENTDKNTAAAVEVMKELVGILVRVFGPPS